MVVILMLSQEELSRAPGTPAIVDPGKQGDVRLVPTEENVCYIPGIHDYCITDKSNKSKSEM